MYSKTIFLKTINDGKIQFERFTTNTFVGTSLFSLTIIHILNLLYISFSTLQNHKKSITDYDFQIASLSWTTIRINMIVLDHKLKYDVHSCIIISAKLMTEQQSCIFMTFMNLSNSGGFLVYFILIIKIRQNYLYLA